MSQVQVKNLALDPLTINLCGVNSLSYLASLAGERSKMKAGRGLTAHLTLLIHLQKKSKKKKEKPRLR